MTRHRRQEPAVDQVVDQVVEFVAEKLPVVARATGAALHKFADAATKFADGVSDRLGRRER